MALNVIQVEKEFSLYSGEDMDSEGPRPQLCHQLCAECMARGEDLIRRYGLKTDAAANAAFERWSAAEAFYRLTVIDEAAGPERVSADGVQITAGERSKKARMLAELRRSELAGLLGEGGFYFARA